MAIIQVGKYTKFEPKKIRWLGHRFVKGGTMAGDLRCPICGKWMAWSMQCKNKYIMQRRWDERAQEPSHCGSLHCSDYMERYRKHQRKLADGTDGEYLYRWMEKKFKNLKEKGLVA